MGGDDMSPASKRKREEDTEAGRKKRSRWGEGQDSEKKQAPSKPVMPAIDLAAIQAKAAAAIKQAQAAKAQATAAAAPSSGGASGSAAAALSAMEKAKRLAEMQKDLKSKLKNVAGVTAPASSAAPAAAPLLQPPSENKEKSSLDEFLEDSKEPALDESNPYFDPNVKVKTDRERKPAFNFVKEGAYVKRAEHLRQREIKKQIEAMAASGVFDSVAVAGESKDATAGLDPNSVPLGQALVDQTRLPAPVPDLEWWDTPVVKGSSYAEAVNSKSDDAMDVDSSVPAPYVNMEKITVYVEHPVPIKPPAEKPPPPAQPMMLTKREKEKLRRQRRLEAQKEKEEKIQLGILPPQENRVKLSNMMKVLTEEAVMDPTQLERKIRADAERRVAEHEKRNADRKLKPEEKREKAIRKLKEDTSTGGIHVALFKVSDLSDPRNTFKVDTNARQLYLTGCVLLHERFNLVLVEGGPKSIKKYTKLMCHRINWNSHLDEKDEDEASEDEDENSKKNTCYLVWQGNVLKKSFAHFRVETARTEPEARRYLKERGVDHYFDMCVNFNPMEELGQE